MQSQRELFERQIALERAEMEAMPEEEEAEMAALYRAKGFREDEAKAIAHRLFENPEHALDQLIREELGLDPDELGSPFGAAFGSFLAFALGAFVPVLPYLFGGRGRRHSSRRSRSASCALFARRRRREPADRSRRPLLRGRQVADRRARPRSSRTRSARVDRRGGGGLSRRGRTPARLPGARAWMPSPWSNGPGDRYGAHEHDYDKVIVRRARARSCSGCRTDGRSVELAAGDRLELPAGTRHDAVVGPAGVTCLEAHLPAGRSTAVARRAAGEW